MSCVKRDVDLQDLAAAELSVHHVVGFVVHEVEVFLMQLGPGEEVEDGDVIRHGFQHGFHCRGLLSTPLYIKYIPVYLYYYYIIIYMIFQQLLIDVGLV